MNRTEFLSYFAWRSQEDLSYAPPEPGAVENVLAAAVDRIDVESYQPQLDAFYALMVDEASKGLWGGELKKNELITGLANLPPEERAKHIVVAAQMLSWLDDLEKVVQGRRPRCAIARSAAGWTIGLVGKFKGYPPEQLANLIRASAGCTTMDASIIVIRGKLLQIMASYAKEIPRDAETRRLCAIPDERQRVQTSDSGRSQSDCQARANCFGRRARTQNSCRQKEITAKAREDKSNSRIRSILGAAGRIGTSRRHDSRPTAAQEAGDSAANAREFVRAIR